MRTTSGRSNGERLLKVMLTIGSLVFSSALVHAADAPALISIWHGEGDGLDSVGANHGVLIGGVDFVPGISGQAFHLDGTSFIHIENSASLRLTNEMTVQMWFKNQNPAGGILFDKRDWTSCSYGAIISTVGGVGLQLYYNDPGYPGYEACLGPLPSNDAWHHFAGTYRQKPTGVEMTVYLDGVAVKTNIQPGTLAAAASTASLAIGAGRDGADTFFTGALDEIAIYNYALSASEVAYNFSGVALPLGITGQPHSVSVHAGDTATFSVSATGASPLSYQWYFTNGPVSGATSATLSIANAQNSAAGSYFVVVSDASGSVTSMLANLTITAPPSNAAPALVSLWRGEGNANDSVGNNHGLLVDGVGFVPGVNGQAFRLDGTNFVRVPDNASLHLTNELTVQMWFRNENPAGGVLFDKRNFTTCNYGAIISTVGGVGLQSYYEDPGYPGYETCLGPLPSNGTWHHFAGTYRQQVGGVKLTVYLDGVPVQTNTRPGRLAATVNTVPLAIGAARDGAGVFFTGAIDEVALYNYALSASEVYSNYNNSGVAPTTVTNLPPVTNFPPVIVSQPTPYQSVSVGGSVQLNVLAFGDGLVSYQWFFNGAALADAQTASLLLTNVQPANAGSYRVVVSNPFGSVTSIVAAVNVASVPTAHGTLLFANSGTNRIYDVGGSNLVASGGSLVVGLYVGTNADTLQLSGALARFLAPGRFSDGTRTIENTSPGQTVFVQVKVWDSVAGTTYEQAVASGGRSGASTVFQVTLAGGIQPPIPLTAMPGFALTYPGQIAPLIAKAAPLPTPVKLTGLVRSSKGWTLTISGPPSATCAIDKSADLIHWDTIAYVVSEYGLATYTDKELSTAPRFFRVRLLNQ